MQGDFAIQGRHFWLSHSRKEGTTGIEWTEARDATKHPTMNRKGPLTPQKELSNLKCQKHRSWETLPYEYIADE